MAPACIAVVDDDPAIRELLEIVLAMAGYDSMSFLTSVDANTGIRDRQPDLALVDLHLERRAAGLAVVEALRTDPATAQIPVILWSSDPDVTMIAAQHTLDRVVVRVKPLGLEELLRLVADLVAAR